jgi:hypothetical protein
MQNEQVTVAPNKHVVLPMADFDNIIDIIRSLPLDRIEHVIPAITREDDKRLLSEGGLVCDLADVVDRIDEARAKHVAPPAETDEDRKAARLKKAEEANGGA